MQKLLVVCCAAFLAVVTSTGVVNAEAGVSALWVGDYVFSGIGVPIKMKSGAVIEPSLQFFNQSTDTKSVSSEDFETNDLTVIRPGVRVDVPFGEVKGVTSAIGAGVELGIFSPGDDNIDSRTDISIHGHVAGSGSVTDGVDLGIRTGLFLTFRGEQEETSGSSTLIYPSSTRIQTFTQIFLRVWIFGSN